MRESLNPLTVVIPEKYEKTLPYAEVARFIKSLSLEENEPFSYRGVEFLLFEDSQEDGTPVEFFASTLLAGGWDIYYWSSVREAGEDFLRVLVCHEVVEVILFKRLQTIQRLASGITDDLALEAHNVAILYEQRFAAEIMDPKRLAEFQDFVKQFREKYRPNREL